MAINVLMNSVDTAHKKYQKSITDFSPSADNAHITEFVQGLNSLTSNTVTGIRKVEITDLLNPEEDTRLDRNLKLVEAGSSTVVTTLSFATIVTAGSLGLTSLELQGDGEFTDTELEVVRNCTGEQLLYLDWASTEDGLLITLARDSGDASVPSSTPVTGTFTFSLPGNTAYKPASVTLTITE